ncbi:MAG: tRNA lysidine(34) synthetase TilS [Actinomycetota bacterium]|jgi:tRNA(Ile)-lysidine synthase
MNQRETASNQPINQVRLVMKRFLSAHSSAGDRIVLAVSGGPDSIAMAAICAQLQSEFSLDFYPVTINHQLQSESDDWAKQTVEVCKLLGLSNATSIAVDVDQSSGNGLEAAARDARYNALREYAKKVGARSIMLAHTMDDQAETVLMRIARGSSTRSLSGMAHISGDLWRPLLDLDRKTLHEALTTFDVPTIKDPHNFNRQFTRVKIRLDVIPKLVEALGQNVISGLARTARMARLDAEALETIASSVYPKCIIENELLIGELLNHPLAIQSRIVHHWLVNKGVSPTSLSSDHIFAICRMAKDPQVKGPIKVTGGVEVQKASGRLRT